MRSRRRTAYENIRMSALSPVSGAGDRCRLAFCIAVEVFGIQTRGRFRRIGEDKAMNRENEKTNPDNIQTEDVSEEILQNLKDAGCDEATIGCYIGCCGCGQDQVKVLKKHRRCLLDKIHEGQKQIDCLDYLLYQMEKEQRKKESEDKHE